MYNETGEMWVRFYICDSYSYLDTIVENFHFLFWRSAYDMMEWRVKSFIIIDVIFILFGELVTTLKTGFPPTTGKTTRVS